MVWDEPEIRRRGLYIVEEVIWPLNLDEIVFSVRCEKSFFTGCKKLLPKPLYISIKYCGGSRIAAELGSAAQMYFLHTKAAGGRAVGKSNLAHILCTYAFCWFNDVTALVANAATTLFSPKNDFRKYVKGQIRAIILNVIESQWPESQLN